ncbi:MAG: hypothetical protein ACYSUI_06295 [Planctomycetota bacterium]
MRPVLAVVMMSMLGVALAAGCEVGSGGQGSGSAAQARGAGDPGEADGAGDGADGGGVARDVVVAQWDFEPTGPVAFASLVPSTVADNVTASDFTSSAGTPSRTTSPGVNWVTEGGWTDVATFLSCTIQAAEGFEIRLGSLDFEQSTFDATGPDTWSLRSSADGFTADLATGGVLVFPSFGEHTVDLTGITIGSAPVEFRWFTVGATGAGVQWGVEEVTFQGDVAPTG